ncbi:hypothetical protein AR686_01930 [Chryseobacterium aquaticum subsp. greenlandense]|uniref:Uncharacterized protein n=1 Tax=Chryseobacterium aquaticum subsp. greenlandense TaxID=345663 RepID=A0A101CJU1_9FLAO|nr:hypothetical protein AR686_01930 [Chryseobacterium aquaticum subsp. greenlandense]
MAQLQQKNCLFRKERKRKAERVQKVKGAKRKDQDQQQTEVVLITVTHFMSGKEAVVITIPETVKNM